MGKNNKIRRDKRKRDKARRRKELKKKRKIRGNDSLGPVLMRMPNPFANLSDIDRKQAIQEIEHNSEKTYKESLLKVRELLHHYDPISLLSILASYGLTVGVGANGIKMKDSDLEIQQSHIEIFQALALQTKPEGLQRQPFGPDVVQELWDTLIRLMRARNYIGLAQGIEDKSEEEKAVRLLQHGIRINTQMVRNWGFFSQVKSISREIYKYFDELLKKTYGFSASNIIDLFQLLIDEIETANSNRHQILSKLYKLKDKMDLLFKYYELIGQPSNEAEQITQRVDIESIPFKSLFAMLMSHYDLRLHENYEFSPQYLSGKLGVDETIIKKILVST